MPRHVHGQSTGVVPARVSRRERPAAGAREGRRLGGPMTIDGSDRQMVLLALALCSLLRPGWCETCKSIAEKYEGRSMFEDFRRMNADQTFAHDTQRDLLAACKAFLTVNPK